MRTAIYTRVSTEEQAKEGYSIEAQENRLKDFANSQGWDVADMYVDDGYSAKNLERPEMKRLIRDITKGKIDVVLVYKLDRMVRSVLSLHELLELFDKHDVKFRSATEMFDTTSAMGRFFITLVGAMAQWERENLAERVRVGMEQKHLNGLRNGAAAPYGYTLQDGELVKDAAEGEVLLRIFDMFRNNNGIVAISKKLNQEKVSKRGAKWQYGSLYYILTNPIYCGKLRWGYRKENGEKTGNEVVVDGNQEPYLTEEEYQSLQYLRESRGKGAVKLNTTFTFSGVLRCGRCGRAMVGSSRKRKNDRLKYYKCNGRHQLGVCDIPVVSEESVTNTFLNFLDWDIDQLQGFLMPKQSTPEEINHKRRLKEIAAELDTIKTRKRRWQLAFGDGAITVSELKELTADDNRAESELNEEAAELSRFEKKEGSRWSLDQVRQQLKQIKETWGLIDDETAKRYFIQELFKSISIDTTVQEAKGGPGRFVPVFITDFETAED